MIDEPRTNADIIRDLLYFAQDREWSGQVNVECHCHPRYVDACPKCDALEYPDDGGTPRTHEPDCELAKLLREAEAFLAAEEEIERRRGDAEALLD